MTESRREIYNNRTGQKKVIHRSGSESGGEVCRIESWNEPNMPAEPFHRHPYQSTTFWVLSGKLGFEVDGKVSYAGAGESAFVPANAVHHFWVEGDEVAHHMQEFRPARKIDRVFETLFGLANDGKLNEDGKPNLLQMAVTLPEYRNEMRPAKPPYPIVLAVCYLLWPIAYLLGYRATDPRYHESGTAVSVPEGAGLGAERASPARENV